jgi:hypothetical protein
MYVRMYVCVGGSFSEMRIGETLLLRDMHVMRTAYEGFNGMYVVVWLQWYVCCCLAIKYFILYMYVFMYMHTYIYTYAQIFEYKDLNIF